MACELNELIRQLALRARIALTESKYMGCMENTNNVCMGQS